MSLHSSLLSSCLALLGVSGQVGLDPALQEPPASVEAVDSAQLLAQAWRQEVEASGARGAASLTRAYRARFQALADRGDGPARLWLLEHGQLEDSAARLALIRDLIRDHSDEAGLLKPRLLGLLEGDPRLSLEEVRALARRLADTARDAELRGGALLALARRSAPAACSDPDRQADARALCTEIAERWPESGAAVGALDLVWRLTHLSVGRRAPGFVAQDARGNQLRSEHLRGRVVVVSFWSFSGSGWSPRLRAQRRWRDRLWDERFTWLGVNLDADREAFLKDCDDWDIDWKQHAWEGGERRPVCEAWRVEGRPLLVLLDDEGVVRGIDLPPDLLETRITSLVDDLRAKIADRETRLEDNAQVGR